MMGHPHELGGHHHLLVDAVTRWRGVPKILHDLLDQLQQPLRVGNPVASRKLALKPMWQKQLQVMPMQLL